MNYCENEIQEEIVNLTRQIAEEKIRPVRAKYDEDCTFPWDVIKSLAQADLFGVYIPEEHGGLGGGIYELCLVTEELSKVCGAIAVSYAAVALGTLPILLGGSDEQKKKYLPDIASGKRLAAFGLTEPGAGSDASNIQTTAKLDGDHYVLNGMKQWITNGGEAEIYSVVAMTDKSKGARGASIIIVEKDTPGFTFGKKENKLGIRSSATRELIFEDCRIPKENLIGNEGAGFIWAMRTFDNSRPGIAAQAIGIAQGALDETIAYMKTREQFGKKIISFQGLQFMLADMATHIEAARALTYNVAKDIDVGEAKDVAKMSAMAKLFASDVAMQVTVDCVQLFGGYGYMKEYPIEKYMRDAKITQIYEGTNQIQREVIASHLIRESARKKK